MSESNFGSDFSKNENSMEEPIKKSKKRVIDEISRQSSEIVFQPGPDEQHELKKRKDSKDTLDVLSEDTIFIDLGKGNKTEEIIIEDSQNSLIEPVKAPVQQLENQTNFWVNKLKYYPLEARNANVISFRELLDEKLLKATTAGSQKNTLESAFFTSFTYDIELIEPLVKNGVKVTLITEPESASDPKVDKNVLGYSNLTIIKLPKNNFANFIGFFRAKLTILKFSGFLRVAIGTGNLCIDDWTIWENCLWFQDFPLCSPESSLSQEKKRKKDDEINFDEDFKSTLKSFLNHVMPSSVQYTNLLDFNLDNYVISNIDVVLIPSTPGRFRDRDMEKQGHRKIASILKKCVPKSLNPVKEHRILTYYTSNLGNANEKFLKELLSSIFPNFITIDELKAEKRYKKILTFTGSDLFRRIRIVYPTKKYVKESTEGPTYASCLSLHSDSFYCKDFPKESFHQFETTKEYSCYEGVIPHVNMFIITDGDEQINDNTYIYLGSHNPGSSAWGKYEKDFSQLSITNYELGVLLPPGPNTSVNKQKLIESLPFKFPPTIYQKGDLPWIADLDYENVVD